MQSLSAKAQIAIALLCTSVLSGCGTNDANRGGAKQNTALAAPAVEEVAQFATDHEHSVDDGWWFGEYPRVLKSAYAGATPTIKARFAVAYAKMLQDAHQDLVNNWDSYVPYTKRSDFADRWWRANDNGEVFAKQDRKMHVVWIHEALLDAGELWWRTFEKKNSEMMPTALVLAHDEEQKKVFNYMDHDGQPRSLSDFVAASR